jgi:hypothetical protein
MICKSKLKRFQVGEMVHQQGQPMAMYHQVGLVMVGLPWSLRCKIEASSVSSKIAGTQMDVKRLARAGLSSFFP